MLNALLRVRMEALKAWLSGKGRTTAKSNSKATAVGFAALMLFALASLGFMFWHYFDTIAAPLFSLGMGWVFFALEGITLLSLMFIGTVFFAKAQLYEAKDNDLLLSLPLTPAAILISRLVMLLVIALFFGLPVIVSAAMTGGKLLDGTLPRVAFWLLHLLLPLFCVALSALFGWILSALTARVKSKAIWGTLLCMAAIVGYYALIAKVNSSIMDIALYADELSAGLRSAAPLWWFGTAIADGRADRLLLLCAICLASVIAAFVLLSRSFIRMATTKHGFARTEYSEKKVAAASPDRALLRRELSRLTSSSGYMVNAGLGLLMEPIAAVALLIKRGDVTALFASDPSLTALAPALMLLGMALLAGMTYITAPSVSLEGSNLWIARSLPVDTRQILRAKLRLQVIVGILPNLLLSVVCAWVFRLDAADTALLIALPLLELVFTAVLGLAENLRHPLLNWTNETQAVKSGVSVLFTMLIDWAFLAAAVLPVVLLGELSLYRLCALLLCAALALASLLLYRWCMSRGAELYESL